jgi:hypothetical protein
MSGDTPRIVVSATLSSNQLERLDKLCEMQQVERDQLIKFALAAYDRLTTGVQDTPFARSTT